MLFCSLSDSTFTRLYREEVAMAFSALDCLLHRGRAIYAGSELTSGRRLYNAFREFQVKNVDELKQLKGKDWYGANIWDANVKSAQDFATQVRQKDGGNTLVVTPARFSARGWTHLEYLAFWEQLLRTRISATWFKSDWQYSNGCTFEFAVCADAGLPTLDHEGNALSVRRATELIDGAIRDLDSSGFETTKLRENLARLRPVAARA